MRLLTLLALAFLAIGAAGCGKAGRLPVASASCVKYAGTYPVTYTGNAVGRGELVVRTPAARPDLIEAKMTLWDDTGTGAVIELAGPGSCEDSVLRIRFGGGDHPKAKVKVLGGVLVALPEPKLLDGLFGGWEVQVLMKEKNTERTLQGYLRQKSKDKDKDKAKTVESARHGKPDAVAAGQKPAS